MIAVWMLYATAFGALIGLAALALERSLRSRRVATRFVWIAAMTATMVVPPWIAFRPAGAALPSSAVGEKIETPSGIAQPPRSDRATAAALPTPARPTSMGFTLPAPTIAVPDTPLLDRVLLFSWILSSLLIAAWSVWQLIVIRRARRGWVTTVIAGTEVLVSRDARAYASLLASVGERMASSARFVPAFSQHSSSLERRIIAMADAARPQRAARTILTAAAALLCVAIACSAPVPAKFDDAGRAPASLLGGGPAPQKFYPRVSPMDTLDAPSIAWLRANVTKYYPAILQGDSSYIFVSLFISDRGTVVGAAARARPTDLKPGERVNRPLFLFGDSAYHYGGDSVNKHTAAVAAERQKLNDDGDSLATLIEARRVLGGIRTVFPRTFDFDSTRGTTIFDPLLGADPHAFQWDEDIRLGKGYIGPRGIEVHLLMFKPARGSAADFGHVARVKSLDRVVQIAPEDTAAYSTLGADAVLAVARCHPPACRPVIWRGPGKGELTVALDSAASPGNQMQWRSPPEEPPPGGQAFQDSAWTAYLTQQEAAPKPRVVWVDGVRRSFAWAKANTTQRNVWGYQSISAAEAKNRLHDDNAPNGALVITTNAHAPPPPPPHAAPN
jgi:hypothetical protein